MLQIQHIYKEYKTGSLVQKALDDVSLNLRDNEFVAISGPSGSGKTTLLECDRRTRPVRQRRPDHQWNIHEEIQGQGLGFLPEPYHRIRVPEL